MTSRGRVSSVKGSAVAPGATGASAEELVRTVGARIGMNNTEHYAKLMDAICANMKKELVLEEWQLAALDSVQWKDLGAPIGLAAAVHALASAASPSAPVAVAPTPSPAEALPSMIASSSALAETHTPMATTRTQTMKNRSSLANSIRSSSMGVGQGAPSVSSSSICKSVILEEPTGRTTSLDDEESGLSPPEEQQGQEGEENNDDYAKAKNSTGNDKKKKKKTFKCCRGADRPVCVTTLSKYLNEYEKGKGIWRTIFTGRAFPMTSRFQQALIHSKSGADLKAHTVFVMELNVLAAALFFGAGVELWASFPMDAVDSSGSNLGTSPWVPQNLALVYHFVGCTNLLIQLVCACGWIWMIHATAAVSPNKFHEFFVQTRYSFDNLMWLSEFGSTLLVLEIVLLLGAQVSATTADPVIRQIGYYIPILFLFIGCRFVHTLSSYVGRVAYHGLLLMDDDPDAIGISNEDDFQVNKDGSAAKAEQDTVKSFHSHNVTCEESVLDIYEKATATPKDMDVGLSMLDVIFPMSKSPNEQIDVQKED